MLELYQFENCPFCKRVREKLSELEIDYVCRNVQIGSRKWEELNRSFPLEQVPFLVDKDRGVSMPESKAIIGYLEKFYEQDRLIE